MKCAKIHLMLFKRSPKQVIHWSKLKTPQDHLAFATATAMGAGLFPKAPGTMGTLFGIPLAWALAGSAPELHGLVILALIILGTWSAKVIDGLMGTGDNQIIVIDEVIGVCITAWTCGHEPISLAAAFIIFRFFDIIKLPPVRAIDRWSKTKGAWWGGFGVIADDIAAGMQGLFVILLLQALYFLK